MGIDEGDRNFGCEVPVEAQAYWWHNRCGAFFVENTYTREPFASSRPEHIIPFYWSKIGY
jgi:hypothetical protein